MDVRRMSVVLDSPHPHDLAEFYGRLTGWEVAHDPDGTWSVARPADGSHGGISVQLEPVYRSPVWPGVDGEQLMMSHLDFLVDDVAEAVRDALAAGASLATTQPDPDDFTVLVDPDGHPFCVFSD